MSIADLLEKERSGGDKIYGVVTGIVTNNRDPDKCGRVKVKIPRLSGSDESAWARVTTFMAGNNMGGFFLPEVNDEVLVVFEQGDINMPYIIGSLWNGTDKPPETNSDGNNDIRIIVSRSGHTIRLTDKQGEEKIEIIDKSEKNSIEINTSENSITIKSEQNINMKAPKGKVSIDAQNIEIKSTANLKIEAAGNVVVKGAKVDIN